MTHKQEDTSRLRSTVFELFEDENRSVMAALIKNIDVVIRHFVN